MADGNSQDFVPSRTLELSPVEQTLKQLLLDVAHFVDQSLPAGDLETQLNVPPGLDAAPLELRFTGGWVRDKLLGVLSHDIDVAINKMTGFQFGMKIKEYLEIPGNAERYGLEGVATSDTPSKSKVLGQNRMMLGGLHRIEANPDKSKHLETVTTKVLGLDIDLVNLRKETYSADSRTPDMEFGTPKEDALRRDATVNALFYNLNTAEVEDFTGQGFQDMDDKIIRTPLEPYQTFKDDPLRVLRLIRFASQLNYSIEVAARQCMANAEIQEALRLKISRERVGVELEKMLRGRDPLRALTLISEAQLYETIFTDPARRFEFTPKTQDWIRPCRVVHDIINEKPTNSGRARLCSTLFRDNEDRYLAYLLSALTPFADAPERQALRPGSKPPPPIATEIAKEGIKATNKVCDVITASVKNAAEIIELKNRYLEKTNQRQARWNGQDPSARDTVGMSIRKWGATWRNQVSFALSIEISEGPGCEEAIVRGYNAFLNHVENLDVCEAYAMKPLIDGKSLASALSTSPGRWMKEALEVVVAYQLRNPGSANIGAAIEEVGKNLELGELNRSLVDHFLQLTIRPLFANQQARTVTSEGRKKMTASLPENSPDRKFADNNADKPWKGEGAFVLDLLRWVLKHCDEDVLRQNWPLIVPPILTVLDDADVSFKVRGCELVTELLSNTPPSLLRDTGLDSVIEDAVMPFLSYLPTLTAESDSIVLLDAAYPALFALAQSRFHDSPQTNGLNGNTGQAKFLTRLLRHGVLKGCSHIGESHPKLAKVLLKHLRVLIHSLGSYSVVHLNNIIPMLAAVLANPFGTSCPGLLISALQALQAVMESSTGRITHWRGEILRGVIGCWINIKEEQNIQNGFNEEGLQVVEQMLKTTVNLMAGAIAKEDSEAVKEVKDALEELEQVDGRLVALSLEVGSW